MRIEKSVSSPSLPVVKTYTSPGGKIYTEPSPNEALHKGHGGDKVKDLQNLLNQAGASPALEADGLFGPGTEAALKKLTGSTSLDPATLAKLKSVVAQTAKRNDGFEKDKPASTQTEMPAAIAPKANDVAPGTIAEKTLAIAEREIGTVDPLKKGADGKFEGWQKLQGIFEKTTGWRPTDADMKSSQPKGKAWCGIFAANVLQQAGVNVKWDLTKGKMVGDVKQVQQPAFHDWRTAKAERSAFEKTVRPGDVITLNGPLNHHAIVSKVNADGTVETIDGNKPGIGRGHAKLSDVTSYYRPTTPGAGSAAATPAKVDAGGHTDFNLAKAEAAVRGNKAREVPWTVDDIRKDPDAFVKNIVQIDGINKTSMDSVSCGTTAILMGMAAGRPDSLVELADALVDDKGAPTAEGKKMFGADANSGALLEAVNHIRNGTFSAKDVTLMAEGMLTGTRDGKSGTSADDLIALRSKISSLGVSVPRMELQQFGNAEGSLGHWRVGINGKQYNPWPDAKGQSTNLSGPASFGDSTSDGKNWINREKIYIDDNTVSRNVYSAHNKTQSWSVTNDPPLFIVSYERQPDGSFNRMGLNAARAQQETKNQLTPKDFDALFRSVPPR